MNNQLRSDLRIPTKNLECMCAEMPDGAVVMSIADGVYYRLNVSALIIWKHIDGRSNLCQIAEALSSAARLERAVLLRDVTEIIEGLSEYGLVSWAADSK